MQIDSNFIHSFPKCPYVPAELTERHNTERSNSDLLADNQRKKNLSDATKDQLRKLMSQAGHL